MTEPEKMADELPNTVNIRLNEGEVMVAAVAMIVVLDGDGGRQLKMVSLGTSEAWDRAGWLAAGLRRQQAMVDRAWG